MLSSHRRTTARPAVLAPADALSITELRYFHNGRMTIGYEWRGDFENAALDALHAEGFGHPLAGIDWLTQVHQHSLGWVCARNGTDRAGELVGFVNVAWDGAAHAFVLDTVVSARRRRRGIGTELIRVAARQARAAGCQWLHVDFAADLSTFYVEAAGFTSTNAGLIAL